MSQKHISSKKLKVFHQNGTVSVFQDGSAADADVTFGQQYDDFFENGADVNGYDNLPASNFIRITLGQLSFSFDEAAQFSFFINDRIVTNYLGIDLNDTVEFWADAGDSHTASIASFPSWHHENQTGQIRVFRGRVTNKTPKFSSDTEGFEIECGGPVTWANDVRIVRDLGTVELPHLVVNPETDEREWWSAVKKADNPTWPTRPTFGTGVPATDGGKLTARDVLAYLNDTYASELTAAGVKDSGVSIFHDDDLEPLTVELPRVDFVNLGFLDAVKKVLNFLPDYGLFVDPKTTQWRIAKTRHNLQPGESTDVTSWTNNVSTIDIGVSDTSLFSTTTTDAGYYALIVHGTDARLSNYLQVQSIGVGEITVLAVGYDYPVGSNIYPMEAPGDQLPIVGVDIKQDIASLDVNEDLDGCYTAVSIYSQKQQTEEKIVSRYEGGSGTVTIPAGLQQVPAWDSEFEDNWTIDKGDRETDNGYLGTGIQIYDHTITGGVSVISYLSAQSAYGTDNDVLLGVGEWQGCAAYLNVHEGNEISAQNPRIASNIVGMTVSSNIAGSGSHGYAITLAHDIEGHADGLGTIYTTASPGPLGEVDSFIITQDLNLKDIDGGRAVTNYNSNFEVYRKWGTSSTTQEILPTENNGANCNVTTTANGIAVISNPPQAGYNPSASTKAPMTFDELNSFWTQKVGSGNFLARGWFLKKPQIPPGQNQCHTKPPEPVKIETKYTTTKASVHQVRIPSSGYTGRANALHGLERELIVSSDRFVEQEQAQVYEDIALAVLRDVSEVQYDGTISALGVHNWLALSDLLCRVQVKNQDYTYHTAGWNYTNKLIAPLSGVTFDIKANRTEMRFDRRGVSNELSARTLETLYVSKDTLFAQNQKAAAAALEAQKKAEKCAAKSEPAVIPSVPSCRVIYPEAGGGGSFGGGKGPTVPPKQEGQGTNETPIAAPTTNGGRGYDYRNFGAGADGFVERDYEGNVSFWPSIGGMIPGTESGDTFTEAPTTNYKYRALPQVLKDDLQNIAGGLIGAKTVYAGNQVQGIIDTGSTTTVIEISSPGLTVDDFADGTLEILDGTPRPVYSITSNTASAVTLSSAMSEAAPGEGAVAVLRAEAKLQKDGTLAADATMIQDANGNWFAVEADGTHTSAEVSGGDLTEKTSSPNTAHYEFGASGVEIEAQGEWDFSSATMKNGKAAIGGERAVASGSYTGAITRGNSVRVFGGNNNNVAGRMQVPTGKELHVLRIEGGIKNGSTGGTYTINYGLFEWGTTSFQSIVSGSGIENARSNAYDEWDGETELYKLSAGTEWLPSIENDNSSPGSTSVGAAAITITYRYVDA